MDGFGIPQGDYILYHGKVIFSHESEEWLCMISGKTRPEYERAQIIGHVAQRTGINRERKTIDWDT